MTTDQLPPLPEPVVYRCEWDTSSGGVWSQYHDNENDPLPDKWDDEQPDVIQGFYSGDQMRERDAMWADQLRAAVMQERERSPLSLTVDEVDAIIEQLNDGHGEDDFEPECPTCTAVRKLKKYLSDRAAAIREGS